MFFVGAPVFGSNWELITVTLPRNTPLPNRALMEQSQKQMKIFQNGSNKTRLSTLDYVVKHSPAA